MKKVTAFAMAAVVAASALTGCGSSSTAETTAAATEAKTEAAAADSTEAAKEDGKTYNVGICQLVQHPALDAATEGFEAALKDKLGDNVKFDLQNASGDSATCATIINQFVSNDVDLILANATAALQAAAAGTSEIPILGTSITDYATALDIDNWTGTTGLNISGTSDLAPLDQQAAMLNELFPDAKNVGLLYCSAEPNSKYQATTVKGSLEELGYTCKEYTFADSNDIASVTTTAAGENDVLYVPTDNTAASNAEIINNICLPAKVFPFSETCSPCSLLCALHRSFSSCRSALLHCSLCPSSKLTELTIKCVWICFLSLWVATSTSNPFHAGVFSASCKAFLCACSGVIFSSLW